MIYLIVTILLVVLAIWGVSEGMQNYAMAKQAEATVETAKAAQVASIGNVLIILLVVMAVLFLIAVVIYGIILLSKRKHSPQGSAYRSRVTREYDPELPAASPDLNQLTQLMTLQILSRMAGMNSKQLDGDHDERYP